MATSDSSPAFDPETVISYKFPETTFSYTERDVVLYALGVGACGANALDDKELHYAYHERGQQHIQVLPTFGTHFQYWNKEGVQDIPGLQFDYKLLLHGQQYLEIYRPIPTRGHIQNKLKVAGFHDKGKAAIIEMETTSYDKDTGEALCMNRSTIYLRGAGGFSKSKPYSYASYPANQVASVRIPNSQPTKVHEDVTHNSQALLYRLSGDYNPLHSDPTIASIAGFNRPILHGLCTYAFAVRAVIKCFCDGDPAAVKSIFGRFLLHVYPGETLVTEMWRDGSRIIYQTKVKERARAVLSGYVNLAGIQSSL